MNVRKNGKPSDKVNCKLLGSVGAGDRGCEKDMVPRMSQVIRCGEHLRLS